MSESHVPIALRRRVAAQARYRCGYCLTSEEICGLRMQLDHIQPEADGGPTVEENLWLACPGCNNFKNARTAACDPQSGDVVRLFDPRRQVWAEHFRWTPTGEEIIGLTPTGRATVAALHMNRPELVRARLRWVSVGWHPPREDPPQVEAPLE